MDYKHERPFALIMQKAGAEVLCPKCGQDTFFKLITEMLEPGIWVFRIGCSCCDWVSHDICEYSGYTPDMSVKMFKDCFNSLREVKNEV